MNKVMISLLAPRKVSPDRIDAWVAEQVYRLRSRWLSGVGIGELRRSSPSKGGHWLIDLDLRARTSPLEQDVALAGIIVDLERLGLRPQLFVLAPGRLHERRVRPAARAFEQIPTLRHAAANSVSDQQLGSGRGANSCMTIPERGTIMYSVLPSTARAVPA